MADFHITFLGTGTSVGVPVIGCDCDVCRSTDPRNKRSRSSIHVRTPDHAWVVDTGPDFRSQCLREDIRHLDAALFTHAHTDHVVGFDDLRRFTFGVDASLPVYAASETMAQLQTMFRFAFDGSARFTGYLKPDPHVIGGPFSLGQTTVSPLPVRHGSVETIGYLFERMRGDRPLRVAYIPDCKTVQPDAVEKMANLDALIIDGLRHTPHPTHMNLEEAVAFTETIAPARVWLTHLSCEIDHHPTNAQLPDHIRLAYDGLKLEL